MGMFDSLFGGNPAKKEDKKVGGNITNTFQGKPIKPNIKAPKINRPKW